MQLLDLVAAYLTAMGVLRLAPTMASNARWLWRQHSSIVANVNLALLAVLLVFLWNAVPSVTGTVLPLTDSVTVFMFMLMFIAIVRLVRDILRLPFTDFFTIVGELILFLGLGTYIVRGGLHALEYGVMTFLTAALLTKGTFQLSNEANSYGILFLLLGVFLHFKITVARREAILAGEKLITYSNM